MRKKRTMTAGEKIVASLQELAEGLANNDPAKITVRTYEVPDPTCYTPKQVKALRTRLGLSQAMFAHVVGVSSKLVEHWESGVRVPAKVACRLLDAIKRDPAPFMPRVKKSA